ncbi:MAG: TCR/Tet family MFS transporter [Candidatus Saccharibacteria bacterium]|nr:TCR/Tet family MFS transporter [Pseudorhodobacter sp.]
MAVRTNLALTFIVMTVTLDAIGIGLIFPVMPDLMMQVTGDSLSQAAVWGGVIVTSFAVMQFLCGPIVGNLSDHYGRRPVLLTSLAVMTVDYVVMGMAQTVWLLLIARMVNGVASATQSTTMAYIADISAPDDRARRFALIGAGFGVGFIAGPVIGGLVAGIDPRAPFWVAAGLGAANLLFGLLIVPESLAPARRRPFTLARANPLTSFAAIRKLPGLRRLLLVGFVFAITANVWPSIWSYYGHAAFDWDARWVGLSLAAYGLGSVIVQALLVGPVIRRLGERRTAIVGLTLEVVTYAFYGVISSGTWALLALPVAALAGLGGPALQGMMSRATPEDQQGELAGINTSLGALSMILAPLVMTALFAWFTGPSTPIYLPGAPFLLSAILMVAAVLLFVAGTREPAPRPT